MSRLQLLFLLSAVAVTLWLQAWPDYLRYRQAMVLRIKSCSELQSGRSQRALGLLEDAWRLDPSQLEIAAEIAELHRQNGQPERGLRCLDRAVALALARPRERALVHAQRGRYLHSLGRYREAARDLGVALDWSPRDLALRRLLADSRRLEP